MKIFSTLAIMVYGMFVAVEPGFAQSWQVTSAPNNRWRSLACSADGTKLVAAVSQYPFIYASTNSGFTWFLSGAPSNNWMSVASSADGGKLVAAAAVIYSPAGGYSRADLVYTSIDSGATWSPTSAPSNQWSYVASSADGSKLIAAAAYNISNTSPGLIFLSTNSGANWNASTAPANIWNAVASSADGTKLLAAAAGIFVSTNSGASWTSNSITGNARWESVAISADGSTFMGVRSYAQPNFPAVLVSTNLGITWTSNDLPNIGWSSVASSADGSRLMASKGHIYISTNWGVSWGQNSIPSQIYGWGAGYVASSADGNKLFLALGADDFGHPNSIYTRSFPPKPLLKFAFLNSNLALSWTVSITNLVIQKNFDLANTNWLAITNTPTLNLTNLQNEVIPSSPDAAGFYRLATP